MGISIKKIKQYSEYPGQNTGKGFCSFIMTIRICSIDGVYWNIHRIGEHLMNPKLSIRENIRKNFDPVAESKDN